MNVFRLLWQSWLQLARHAWLWAATFVVFFLAFLSIQALLGANVLANRLLAEARQRVDISVSFRPEMPPALLEQAKTYLLGLPGVAEVRLTSADQALETFRQRHQYQEDVLRALQEVERNPFGSKLVVRAKTLADYPTIAEAFKVPVYASWIQSQSTDDQAIAIAELEALQRAVRLTGSLLLLLFSCVGLLLAFNAVRLAVFAQRDEIAVMRLVGATRLRIRGPYLLSVLWVVLLSWGTVLLGLAAVSTWLAPQLSGWAQAGLFALREAFLSAKVVFVSQLGIAAILSMLVAWIATGKYIKR